MIRRSHLAVLLLALPLCASAQGLGGWLDRLFPKNNQSTTQSSATGLAAISSADQVGGLRQALMQGAEIAVKNLAQQNGYLDNSKVRIPLPDKLQKADTLMRKIGMGKYADDLIASMNHAAEAAVPEARDLLVDAAKQMTVADATTILTGGEDAATQYFRSATQAALAEKFKPIVSRSMQNVTLAKTYDQFAG
ncbi:MAG: DUF4197 domain-containing protein, partial [Nevskiaceae bacterium]|nr:DUF4197 domain-containing protein [Nevskiaceae bacterium]